MTQVRAAQGQTCDGLRHFVFVNPFNTELNPTYHLLALLGAHHILHVTRIMFNLQISDRTWHSAARSGVHNPDSYEYNAVWGYAMALLVEALHYKPEGRWFDSRWCHWNYSLT